MPRVGASTIPVEGLQSSGIRITKKGVIQIQDRLKGQLRNKIVLNYITQTLELFITVS